MYSEKKGRNWRLKTIKSRVYSAVKSNVHFSQQNGNHTSSENSQSRLYTRKKYLKHFTKKHAFCWGIWTIRTSPIFVFTSGIYWKKRKSKKKKCKNAGGNRRSRGHRCSRNLLIFWRFFAFFCFFLVEFREGIHKKMVLLWKMDVFEHYFFKTPSKMDEQKAKKRKKTEKSVQISQGRKTQKNTTPGFSGP